MCVINSVIFRYLASGMNFGDLEFDFKISRKTIPLIVRETCLAIWNVIQPEEIPIPTKELWIKKSKEFYQITQFPNCVGSIDGKHITIICPPNSGSEYFNYKKYFSMVLFALGVKVTQRSSKSQILVKDSKITS